MTSVQPDPNCPVCGGRGFRLLTTADSPLPVAGGPCVCVEAARAVRDAERREAEAGLLGVYAEATVDGFNVRSGTFVEDGKTHDRAQIDGANQERVRELAAEPLPTGATIVFVGPSGVGKSYLAAALLRAQIRDHARSGFYITSTKYLRLVKPDGDEPAAQRELQRRVREVDVLLLDEIAAEKQSAFSNRELLDVFNEREAAGRATIVTSNVLLSAAFRIDADPDKLPAAEREALELGWRIFDRMRSARVVIAWPKGMDSFREEIYRASAERRAAERKGDYRAARREHIDLRRDLADDEFELDEVAVSDPTETAPAAKRGVKKGEGR